VSELGQPACNSFRQRLFAPCSNPERSHRSPLPPPIDTSHLERLDYGYTIGWLGGQVTVALPLATTGLAG
jgi:hypothetical protein